MPSPEPRPHGPAPEDSPVGEARLPWSWIYAVLVISLLPAVLLQLGVSLEVRYAPDLSALPPSSSDLAYRRFAGPVVHTILEWTAFCLAAFTAILAFIHFRIRRDAVTPVLGVALLAAGCMDAFHILAADRLLGTVGDPERFVPFTWAISRLFNSAIILGGALLLLLPTRRNTERDGRFVLYASLFFGLGAAATALIAAGASELPRTYDPVALITRPWDAAPLGIFLIGAATVLPMLYRRHPSAFAHALLVSMIPQVVTQLHMVFGSTELFDSHFNAAHLLKIVAYAVPFAGLALAYVQTHRREVQARVERAEAEADNRHKSSFMATMSHELRTPLNAILGYTDLLEAGIPEPLSPAAREQVGRIGLSARHQLQLINEILSFSRLEAGVERVDAQDVDIDQLLAEVESIIRPLASAKGLDFEIRADDAPSSIRTDPRKLRQILVNLLGNAVKFTQRGGIDLGVRAEEGATILEISDTGIGISAEDRERLFEPFWQTDQSNTRTAPGTGLGLAITDRFARMLGGGVTVQSTPGVGTSFTLRIPRDSTETPEQPDRHEASIPRRPDPSSPGAA